MSCELRLHIVPGSKKNAVAGFHGDAVRIKIQARAVDGKANEALIDFLAEILKIKPRYISIAKGLKSREKTIIIQYLKKNDVLQRIGIK